MSAAPTDAVAHPADPGVLLGAVGALQGDGYDAVVSLCRVCTADVKVAAADHARFWLIDSALTAMHVEFVLRDAPDAVPFRVEGKWVLLHCVRMESRTPTVAALYGAKVRGVLGWSRSRRSGRCFLRRRRTGPSWRCCACVRQGRIGPGLEMSDRSCT